MRKLTLKQERFCTEYIQLGNKSKAYKKAYSTVRMKPETINSKAYLLSGKDYIRARIKDLQKIILDEKLYDIKESIRRDLKLIDRYENSIDILLDEQSNEEAVKVAERTLKHIGSHGYNSIQNRLSTQLGFYEKDNHQKKDHKPTVHIFIPHNGRKRILKEF